MEAGGRVKHSVYIPDDMLAEITAEANRQNKSLSWIVNKTWKLARATVRKMPSANEPSAATDELPLRKP